MVGPLQSYEAVKFTVEDAVACVTLCRPQQLNALNDLMATELNAVLDRAEDDASVRSIILTGHGRAFCSGQDLRDFPPDRKASEHLQMTWNPLVLRIARIKKPVIAAVNGVAVGAGASLALACDMRLASDAATFIFGFSRIGLAPDAGCTWALPRLVGHARALELCWLAEPVNARSAEHLGLVNRVTSPDLLLGETMTMARRIAGGPTLAYALTKRLMLDATNTNLEEALGREATAQDEARASRDHREGVKALLQSRSALFVGA
jgi:2-(1,2-epoxy-1,2-dihydrophenyl)acetyl-CoA isomerase